MAKRITYLLGAGASAQAIPVVKSMPSEIDKVIRILVAKNNSIFKSKELIAVVEEEKEDPFGKDDEYPLTAELEEIVGDLKWLHEQSLLHSSVDTAAKKFFIVGDEAKLSRLKRSLSIFFLLLQSPTFMNRSGQGLDKRYDKFWASILKPIKHENIVPENISIITWNYDYQLMITFLNFVKSLSHAKQTYSNPHDLISREGNGFFMTHLNGVAGLYWDASRKGYFNWKIINSKDDKETIQELIEHYKVISNPESQLHFRFAWEYLDNTDDSFEKKYLSKVLSLIADTDVFVIIGYSFPDFNRDIDKMIINSLKNLRKVYVQVGPKSYESIKYKLEEIFGVRKYSVLDEQGLVKEEKIFPAIGTDEFFIPPEF